MQTYTYICRYVYTYVHTHQSRTNYGGETRWFGCPSCCDDKLRPWQSLERNFLCAMVGSPGSDSQSCSCLTLLLHAWSSPSCLQVKPTALYTDSAEDCWWANRTFFLIKVFSHNNASYLKYRGRRGRKAEKFSSAHLLHSLFAPTTAAPKRGAYLNTHKGTSGRRNIYEKECLL